MDSSDKYEYTGLLTGKELASRKLKIIENKKKENLYRIFTFPDKESIRKKISEAYKKEKMIKKTRTAILLEEQPKKFIR
jgi:hypothetical protein